MHSWSHLLLFTSQRVLGCYPVGSEIIGGHNKNRNIQKISVKDQCVFFVFRSISIYLDTINIFIRIAMILASGGSKRK